MTLTAEKDLMTLYIDKNMEIQTQNTLIILRKILMSQEHYTAQTMDHKNKIITIRIEMLCLSVLHYAVDS